MDTTRRKIKSFRRCVWSIVACLLVNIQAVYKVNALELGTTGKATITTGSRLRADNTNYSGTTTTAGIEFASSSHIDNFQKLTITLSSSIPENSIGHFQFRYSGGVPTYYAGLTTDGTSSILNSSCVVTRRIEDNGESYPGDATCDYYVHSKTSLTQYVFIMSGGAPYGYNLRISGVDWTQIPESSSGAQEITNSVNSFKNQIETNRQDDQTSQESSNQDANSATSRITEKITEKSTLLGLFYDLIHVLTTTEATNCNIPMYQPDSGTSETINLCQGENSTVVSAIRNLASVAATLWCAKAGVSWYHRFVEEVNEVSE